MEERTFQVGLNDEDQGVSRAFIYVAADLQNEYSGCTHTHVPVANLAGWHEISQKIKSQD